MTQHPSPVTVGELVRFTCKATCFPRGSTIKWKLDPPLPVRTGNQSSSLNSSRSGCIDLVRDISFTPSRDHVGLTASCRATSPLAIITENATLVVQGIKTVYHAMLKAKYSTFLATTHVQTSSVLCMSKWAWQKETRFSISDESWKVKSGQKIGLCC